MLEPELFGRERVLQAAQQLEQLVFLGTNTNMTAELAHLVVPTAVYAEKDGTFTNFEGRVQRVWAALNPAGDAKPDWMVLTELAGRLGVPVAFPDAATIFAELAAHERPFKGLTYQAIGHQGASIT